MGAGREGINGWASLGVGLIVAGAGLAACSDSGLGLENAGTTRQAWHGAPTADDLGSRLRVAHKAPPIQLANGTGFHVRPVSAVERDESLRTAVRDPRSRFVAAPPFEGLRIGMQASAPLRLTATGGPQIGVRRLDAGSGAARVQDDTVVVESATSGVDAIIFATEHGVEDLWRVAAPRASWGYELDLPQGWRIRAASNVRGLAEVRDERDVARLRVWAKRAWDAQGQDVSVDIAVEGNRIRVNLGEAGAWPVMVDPEWSGTEAMIYPRSSPSVTVMGNGKVLVAGGDI